MSKTKTIWILAIALMMLIACGNTKLLEETRVAVDEYNKEATSFNEKVKPYNEAVEQIEAANKTLQATLDAAQKVINNGEEPYDPETLEQLKSKLVAAGEAKKATPEEIAEYKSRTVSEESKKDELEVLKSQAEKDIEMIKETIIPDIPEIPNYEAVINDVIDAQGVYEDSIMSLKQITAPSDDFVMERLQRVETITEMGAVTPDHDPNGQLNKQGGYIGCIYFTDTQVDRSRLYIEPGKDNVIDIATEGGGAIEVFATKEEAEVRNNYLGTFDGMGAMSSGSHYVEGTCLIRTSNHLNGTQQKELTSKITEALIAVDK